MGCAVAQNDALGPPLEPVIDTQPLRVTLKSNALIIASFLGTCNLQTRPIQGGRHCL